jgi:outer membrane protein assembly factor BamB
MFSVEFVSSALAVPPQGSAIGPRGQTDWPRFHFDNHNSGSNPYEITLDPSTVGRLQMAWSFAAAGNAPAIAGGVLYLATGAGIQALDAESGAPLWLYQDTNVSSAPTVANGLVYFASYNDVVAIDAGTGQFAWSHSTGGTVATPAVDGDTLLAGSSDNFLYALDALTGALRWKFFVRSEVRDVPAIAGGRVYFEAYDFQVFALTVKTGHKVWSTSVDFIAQAPPVVANGLVYATGDGMLTALGARGGQIRWTVNGVGTIPAVAVGHLFVGMDHAIASLDASSGATEWTRSLKHAAVAAPIEANGVLYFTSARIYAANAATGKVLWRDPNVGGQSYADPAVVNGTLYVNSRGALYAFRLP